MEGQVSERTPAGRWVARSTAEKERGVKTEPRFDNLFDLHFGTSFLVGVIGQERKERDGQFRGQGFR